MADEPTKRTTSFAKTLADLVKEGNSLDRVASVFGPFTRAAEGHEDKTAKREDEQEKTTPADARKFDHAPRPELHLRPDGPARRSIDRKIDADKLRAINNAAKRRIAEARSRDLQRDFDRER